MQNFLGSDVLDVGIGMTLLFLFASLICSAVREGLEGLRKSRARFLHNVLCEIMNDSAFDGLVKQLFNHPSIYALFKGVYPPNNKGNWWKDLPSYVPAGNFSSALFDIIVHGDPAGATANAGTAISIASIRANIATLNNAKLERVVLAALDAADTGLATAAKTDLAAAATNVEAWYNSAMDRVSGWYKQKTQLILFLLGFAVAATLNIDAITVMKRLEQDKALRGAVVARAEVVNKPAEAAAPAGASDPNAEKKSVGELKTELDNIGYPMGWKGYIPAPQSRIVSCSSVSSYFPHCNPKGNLQYDNLKVDAIDAGTLAQTLLGWLITAFAITLGAPFWFDVLNKFMVVRSTVKPKEKSGDEPSKS